MSQEDGFDSILKMFPEHLYLDKLKEIKKRSNEQIKLTQKLNSDISSGKIKLYESYDDIDIDFDYFI